MSNTPREVLYVEVGVLDVLTRWSRERHLNLLVLHLQAVKLFDGAIGVLGVGILHKAIAIAVVGLKTRHPRRP